MQNNHKDEKGAYYDFVDARGGLINSYANVAIRINSCKISASNFSGIFRMLSVYL